MHFMLESSCKINFSCLSFDREKRNIIIKMTKNLFLNLCSYPSLIEYYIKAILCTNKRNIRLKKKIENNSTSENGGYTKMKIF